MATWYVRTTGSDSTGTGAPNQPYRTINKAISVWANADVVDVGTGTFTEMINWTSTVVQGTIRGKGFSRTRVIASPTSNGLAKVTSALAQRILIMEMTIEQKSLGMDILRIESGAANSRFILARCLLLMRDGYVVNITSSVGTIRADLLNCVVAGIDPQNKLCRAVRGSEANTVCARNSVFINLALVVDDVSGGAAQDFNYNVYLACDRLFRVGAVGEQDIIDPVALFTSESTYDFTLRGGSPLRAAGIDLNEGYGEPERLPPPELNWLYAGEYPDIGIEEKLFPQGTVVASNFNFHLILQVFAEEFQRVLDYQTQIKRNRNIGQAEAAALSRRWGVWLSAIRPSNMTEADYRDLLLELMDLFFTSAPASLATQRICQMLFGVFPYRIDYHSSRRFPLSTDLKLKVVTPTPSLTVRLNPGRFQIQRYWYRMLQTDLTVPVNDTTIIYSDGTTSPDGILATALQSTDLDLRKGFRLDNLTGTSFFEKGSATVLGTGTLFLTQVAPLDKIRANGTQFFYLVEEVVSDTELTLQITFVEDDITDVVQLMVMIELFGEVTTNATSITDITGPGRLSQSAILNSAETKSHGYHLILYDGGTDSIFSLAERVVLLKEMLWRMKPVHKLGYVSFESDLPQGFIMIRNRSPFNQSLFNYLEDWEDSTWPDP